MTGFALIYVIGIGVALLAFSGALAYCSFIVPNRDGIDPKE